MRRVKQRTFSGAVCEQIVYSIGERADLRTAKPRKPRFENEEDRAAHREAISRKKNAQLINANFSPTSYYSTLTFALDCEVHTAEECKREMGNYTRRLLYRYPAAKVYLVYGKGRHTARFHLHMISDGIPEEEIGKCWGRGSVLESRRLRAHNYYKNEAGELIDHGQDYTGLANYLFDHWRPEFGGHRWRASRTCCKPEAEAPMEAVREYSPKRPPVAPKGYTLVEARATKYGYQYYKYVYLNDRDDRAKKRKTRPLC